MNKNNKISFSKFLKQRCYRNGWGFAQVCHKIEEIKIILKEKEKGSLDYNLILLERELYQMRKHHKLSLKYIYKIRNQIRSEIQSNE